MIVNEASDELAREDEQNDTADCLMDVTEVGVADHSRTIDAEDRSRCGELDVDVVELVTALNSWPAYRTTSSCAGRVLVYRRASGQRKRGCEWLLTSHAPLDWCQVQRAVTDATGSTEKGLIWFKYEAFILHCACETLAAARLLLQCALGSGFRESGLVLGGRRPQAATPEAPWRLTVAVRSATSLDIPLWCDEAGNLLVTGDYLRLTVELANAKLAENASKRERFLSAIRLKMRGETLLAEQEAPSLDKLPYRRKRRAALNSAPKTAAVADEEETDCILEQAAAIFQQDVSS